MYRPLDFFNEDELVKIRRFEVSIRNNIIPLQYKDHFFIGSGQIWDIDTYTAECCRCLTLTESEYIDYRRPLRHEANVVNPDLMARVCYEYKVPSFLKLKNMRNFADDIIVCEAGRGIDVLLAALVKPWRRIVAYDQDKGVLHEMTKYFKGDLGLPFEAQQCHTQNYNFSGVNENSFVLGTCHNVGKDKLQEILGNEKLLGIFDGEMLST